MQAAAKFVGAKTQKAFDFKSVQGLEAFSSSAVSLRAGINFLSSLEPFFRINNLTTSGIISNTKAAEAKILLRHPSAAINKTKTIGKTASPKGWPKEAKPIAFPLFTLKNLAILVIEVCVINPCPNNRIPYKPISKINK